MTGGWILELFHQQLQVDQRFWGKYSWMRWGPKLQETETMPSNQKSLTFPCRKDGPQEDSAHNIDY